MQRPVRNLDGWNPDDSGSMLSEIRIGSPGPDRAGGPVDPAPNVHHLL
jgi:hypothetical protein